MRSNRCNGGACLLALCAMATASAGQPSGVAIRSPGLAASTMDATGALVEDWGAVKVTINGAGIPASGAFTVAPARLAGNTPGASATGAFGPVKVGLTAFRAPAWPAGVDVLTARVEETTGAPAKVTLTLELPEGAQMGARTVSLGGRTILSLPAEAMVNRPEREWGYADEATAIPGWAHPEGACDPAFRNIRAGMGGVPIVYRFPVAPGGRANVVLGFCESHWAQSGQRPVTCRVEGAPSQTVDPIAKWGQHKPGVLEFAARDANGDGKLDVVVAPGSGASDRNPILNVIWVFPPEVDPDLAQVMAGKQNDRATFYVDVGGEKDQSLYPPGKLTFDLTLSARGAAELSFLVACPGASAPVPTTSAWTVDSLRKAAQDVWRSWPGE